MRAPRLLAACALAILSVTAPVACGEDEEDEPLVGVAESTYGVTLPEPWVEASEEEKAALGAQAGQAFESAAGGEIDVPDVGVTSLWFRGEPGATTPTAITISEPLPAEIGEREFVTVSLANAERAFAEQITRPPRERDEVEVAGDPSRVFDYSVRFGDRELDKRALFVFRDERVYTLTLTALPPDFDEAAAELDEILSSWRWS